MASPNERLSAARRAAGFRTATEAAKALNVPAPSYLSHENGTRNLNMQSATAYAQFFKVDTTWLLFGTGNGPAENEAAPSNPQAQDRDAGRRVDRPQPNATVGEAVRFSRTKIPLYGQSAAGLAADGRFILNGQKISDILAPPILDGVRGAYAVYVFGESMEPRYYAGEVLFVDPNRPVRRGDFCVVQIRDGQDDVPLAFVKRFSRLTGEELIVEQFNPPEGSAAELRFPAEDLVSIHKIVASGEG